MQLNLYSRLAITALTTLTACSNSPTRPTEPTLEGTYTATTYTVVTPDSVFDELADGVTLTLTLHADGTTTGSLSAPPDLTDLAGHWDTASDTLHLHLPNAIVFNLIPFAIAPNRLVGDLALQFATFHLILAK